MVDFSDGEGKTELLVLHDLLSPAGVFGLLVRSPEDTSEQVLVFRTPEGVQQQTVVNDLVKLLAQHNCSTMLVTIIFIHLV